MSIALELSNRGKAGKVCSAEYRRGSGCPLIVRQTSEDVLTANVFGILRRLRASLWLRPLLKRAFQTDRFADPPMTDLHVDLWRPVSPPSLRQGIEGDTEVDVLVQFDESLLFIESKYRAELSKRTKHDPKRDQLARILDVAYSFAVAEQLYQREPLVLVLGLPETEPELVTRYRDAKQLAHALDHYKRFPDHKRMAAYLSRRVGYCSWSELAQLLEDSIPAAKLPERPFLIDVRDYIRHKVRTAHVTADDQLRLPAT